MASGLGTGALAGAGLAGVGAAVLGVTGVGLVDVEPADVGVTGPITVEFWAAPGKGDPITKPNPQPNTQAILCLKI
jgi:hypothetical protein